jgi:hypothetical protein
MTWITAFAITQAVELPVYLVAGRRLDAGRRWLLALGASLVTHPLVWFAFPWQTAPWELCFLAGETFAVVAEGALGRLAGLRHPWLWSLAANASSVAVGMVIQEVGR